MKVSKKCHLWAESIENREFDSWNGDFRHMAPSEEVAGNPYSQGNYERISGLTMPGTGIVH